MDPKAVNSVFVDLPSAVLKAINAVRDSKYAQEHLGDELTELENMVALLRPKASEAGVPTTPAGDMAKQQLNSALTRVNEELQQLRQTLLTGSAEPDSGAGTSKKSYGHSFRMSYTHKVPYMQFQRKCLQ